MMLKLNLQFLSVAFFYLTSTCFTSFVQSICNRGCDLDSNHIITNTTIPSQDTISQPQHANSTTANWIQRFNTSDSSRLPDPGNFLVTVNGTIGDGSISKYDDSFLPAHLSKKTLNWVATADNSSGLIYRGRYDQLISLRALQEGEDEYNRPLNTCSGLSYVVVVGITVGAVAVVLGLARCLYNGIYRKKAAEISSPLLKNAQIQLVSAQAPNGYLIRGSKPSGVVAGELASITANKSVEFSHEELSKATHDFSLSNKIGEGGFGAVYYAELSGKKAAIKKMDMNASKELIAELKVLTHVHHLNLVCLVGYCVESSLFLVYEYVENGNLSQHLHESGREPLPWSTRVQIALDSARGLEYIHEYTLSVFIHCDIKSANILIDKNLHGKVADFGLTKLTGVGSRSRLGGTFGYMPPEYVQYGDVSPKVDVYAFGVVLYELISAKKTIIRPNDSASEPKGLVALFDEVLSQEDPKDGLVKLIDPRLGDSYPLDSMHKMAQLAKTCTHEDPQQRPSMRSVVVALMSLINLRR